VRFLLIVAVCGASRHSPTLLQPRLSQSTTQNHECHLGPSSI
jgi:hypothetical protein